jgi:hypothetical protein
MQLQLDGRPNHRVAAGLALGSAFVALVAVGQTWLSIRVGGMGGPGSSQTGWDGRDGWTVAVAAGLAAVGAGAMLLGRKEMWLRITLFIAGSAMLVIAIVNLAGVRSKADDLHVLYGIPTTEVKAQVGIGLVLIAFASVGIITGALLTQRLTRDGAG